MTGVRLLVEVTANAPEVEEWLAAEFETGCYEDWEDLAAEARAAFGLDPDRSGYVDTVARRLFQVPGVRAEPAMARWERR